MGWAKGCGVALCMFIYIPHRIREIKKCSSILSLSSKCLLWDHNFWIFPPFRKCWPVYITDTIHVFSILKWKLCVFLVHGPWSLVGSITVNSVSHVYWSVWYIITSTLAQSNRDIAIESFQQADTSHGHIRTEIASPVYILQMNKMPNIEKDFFYYNVWHEANQSGRDRERERETHYMPDQPTSSNSLFMFSWAPWSATAMSLPSLSSPSK